jgi:hypothetical protein
MLLLGVFVEIGTERAGTATSATLRSRDGIFLYEKCYATVQYCDFGIENKWKRVHIRLRMLRKIMFTSQLARGIRALICRHGRLNLTYRVSGNETCVLATLSFTRKERMASTSSYGALGE